MGVPCLSINWSGRPCDQLMAKAGRLTWKFVCWYPFQHTVARFSSALSEAGTGGANGAAMAQVKIAMRGMISSEKRILLDLNSRVFFSLGRVRLQVRRLN